MQEKLSEALSRASRCSGNRFGRLFWVSMCLKKQPEDDGVGWCLFDFLGINARVQFGISAKRLFWMINKTCVKTRASENGHVFFENLE